MPSAFYVTGGSLEAASRNYVRRAADDQFFNCIANAEFCYVLTTRQMGKSSLMIRTARRLMEQDWVAVIIDLTQIGSGKDVTGERWYYSLCEIIADQVELDVDLGSWWEHQSHLPLSQRFLRLLRDVVLKQCHKSIVIFVDEIDSMLKLDFSDDFFASIRTCFNTRATEPEFKRLTFALLGGASPADLMQDRTRTPFYIGTRVELTDYTPEEARKLAAGLSEDVAVQQALMGSILKWSGGHPYLTQAICAACEAAQTKTPADVDRVVNNEFLEVGKAKHDMNLSFVRERLLSKSLAPEFRDQLLRTYGGVLKGEPLVDDPQSPVHSELKLCGVVKTTPAGTLEVRNQIYRRVFDAAWLREVSPAN